MSDGLVFYMLHMLPLLNDQAHTLFVRWNANVNHPLRLELSTSETQLITEIIGLIPSKFPKDSFITIYHEGACLQCCQKQSSFLLQNQFVSQ